MLSTPPAFILSQDQTLKINLIQFKINILANLSLLLFYKVSSLNIKTFLESFKVVSLFNYQGSLLLSRRSASLFYQSFYHLSRAFFIFLNSFFKNLKAILCHFQIFCSLKQLVYNSILSAVCQQVFLYFYCFLQKI